MTEQWLWGTQQARVMPIGIVYAYLDRMLISLRFVTQRLPSIKIFMEQIGKGIIIYIGILNFTLKLYNP